jgi:hypothetical protein
MRISDSPNAADPTVMLSPDDEEDDDEVFPPRAPPPDEQALSASTAPAARIPAAIRPLLDANMMSSLS